MIKWGNRILFSVNILALVVALLYFGWKPLVPGHENIEYKDLIAIILTALAVLLAAVTLFVAAMAIWGYNSIRQESVRAAVSAAEAEATRVAKNTAQAVASREAIAMLGVLKGDGKPNADDELAAALQSEGGPAKPQ